MTHADDYDVLVEEAVTIMKYRFKYAGPEKGEREISGCWVFRRYIC